MVHYQIFIIFIALCFGFSHTDVSSNHSSKQQERTYIMVKPDGLQRGLVHEIIKRFEKKGLKLVGMKLIKAQSQTVAEHYEHLKNQPFYSGLIEYMTSGPVIPMVWEGYNAVEFGRNIIGETNPSESPIGTIRGDFCLFQGLTVVHGAHSVQEANREIGLWFKVYVSKFDTVLNSTRNNLI
ncbi:hypothetical protein ACKWTF_002739 [Chironomus riparius]